MAIHHREILSIVQLAYYVSALPVAVFVVCKHGSGRQLGWIFLVMLSVLRVAGSSMALAAASASHPSAGLVEAAAICEGIGIAPLLLALFGLIKRVDDGIGSHALEGRLFHLAGLPAVIGLVLGIIAGPEEYSSNPSTRSEGYHFLRGAVMLFLISWAALSALAIFNVRRLHRVLEGERRLTIAAAASIPFIFVRIIYAIIYAFNQNSSVFSVTSDSSAAVIVQAVMAVAMEIIVVTIFLAAGLLVRVIPRSMVKQGSIEPPRYNATAGPNEQVSGVTGQPGTFAYPMTHMSPQQQGVYIPGQNTTP